MAFGYIDTKGSTKSDTIKLPTENAHYRAAHTMIILLLPPLTDPLAN